MEQTDLLFENSKVYARISGQIDSVKNPECREMAPFSQGAMQALPYSAATYSML